MAIQATQTTPQIIFKQLNLNVLKAPTLAEDTDGGKVNPDNNQLTYTFKWTQEDMKATDAAPVYQIKLYGLLTDENGNVTGQEQIALKDTLTPTQNDNSFTLPVNVDTCWPTAATAGAITRSGSRSPAWRQPTPPKSARPLWRITALSSAARHQRAELHHPRQRRDRQRGCPALHGQLVAVRRRAHWPL